MSSSLRRFGWVLVGTFVLCGCSSSGGDSGGGAAAAGGGELKKLPAPAGATTTYADANIAMYVTEAPVDAVTAECKKLLLADGWVPYGTAGETQFFKRDLTRLTAMISSAPAQGGKTMIQYSQTVMTADLPPPPEPVSMNFADSLKRLDFDSAAKSEDLFKDYAATLKKQGWEPTTEKPIVDGFKSFQIFRNPQKDMLTLEVRDVKDVRRGHLAHMSAAEVEEMDRKFKEAQAKAAAEKEKPPVKVQVPLPTDAAAQPTAAETAKDRGEFKMETGKARLLVDFWRKHFTGAGWKEEATVVEPAAGSLTYSKEGQSITLSYVDPGFIPAEITLTASGVELEWPPKK